MKAKDIVILVGGKGSRLGKITNVTAKPLIKINNQRFLDYLLIKLSKYNFNKIYLLCSYKKDTFFKLYHNVKFNNSKIVCIDEGISKGTGGALFKVKNKIKNDFILLNGDTLFDINMDTFSNIDLKDKYGCIALTNKKNSFNNKKIINIKTNKDNIISFSNQKTNLMNGGVYLLSKKIFNFIENKNISLENDILNNLIIEKKIYGLFYNDYFVDIGSKIKLEFIKKNSDILLNKAVFLDRDGVINKDTGYITKYSQFNFLPGVKKAIKYINDKRYLLILITNQAAIGKSLLTEINLKNIHLKMTQDMDKFNGGYVNDIYFSPYYKFSKKLKYRLNKNDRKPNNGMIKKAIKKWNIDISSSIFIGDKLTDEMAANKSNLKFYLKKNISMFKQIKKLI